MEAILHQKFRLGRVLYHVLESLAHKLDFVRRKSHRKKRCENIPPMRLRVRSYLRPHLPAFVFALAQVAFISALSFKPLATKIIIDHVLTKRPCPGRLPIVGLTKPFLFACGSGGYLLARGLRMLNDYTTIKSGRRWSTICVGIFTVKSSVLSSSPPSGGRSTYRLTRYLRDPDAHDERPFPGVMLLRFSSDVFGDDPQ